MIPVRNIFRQIFQQVSCRVPGIRAVAGYFYDRGSALWEAQRYEEAIASFDRALAFRPCYPEAYYQRGNTQMRLGRPAEALASYDCAIALKHDYANAYYNRGLAMQRLQRHEEAVESFDRALGIQPDDAESYNNRGIALGEHNRHDAAVESFDRAIALKPDYADALYNRGSALTHLKRFADAVESFARLIAACPDYSFAKGYLLHAKMCCCDWEGLSRLYSSIRQDVAAGKKSAEPFGFQAISESTHDLQVCAKLYAAEKFPTHAPASGGPKARRKPKIRIGYLSGEFRDQATSVLMAELFEVHDKSRFEIFAFDNGWDDRSELRRRIKLAFDELVDIAHLDDLEAVAAIKAREVDILVNLNGYFGHGRQAVFSHRASPIQVNYLGFPGTLGADYIDYLIADRMVIPEKSRADYAEKIVYLPHSYQVNDRKRHISSQVYAREASGLPRDGFVFCCFNNVYKITPGTFDVWMRILERVEGSVLWLVEDRPDAGDNLREEARRRGVDAARLVFAQRFPLPEHLSRHRLADLFLDTLPYNAHTTASDALWAGLPLVTCAGATFPGRVGASLLNALELPELVTATFEAYEATAVDLATNPRRLAELRQKLQQNRLTKPLFDTPRFAQHIEAAYTAMYERYHADRPPDHLTIGL